jgi:hypothetical protein
MYDIKHKAEFYIGQPVYLKTDPDQQLCIVVAYRVTENGIAYECSKGHMRDIFNGIELSDQKNVGQYG